MGRRVTGCDVGGCARTSKQLQIANCKMQIANWRAARRALSARRVRNGAIGRLRFDMRCETEIRRSVLARRKVFTARREARVSALTDRPLDEQHQAQPAVRKSRNKKCGGL
jgi:hypothetical protein